MATVKSLGDGRWQVRVYLDLEDDGPVLRPSKVVTARNRPQAEAKANDWLRELKQSGRRDLAPHTVADAADAWYEACVDRGLAESTLRNFAYHRDAIKAALGDIRLDRLTTRTVERYYNDIRRSGIGVKHRHRALRAILFEAVHLQWLGVNVALKARRPAEVADRGDPPTIDQVLHLIEVAYARSEETGNFLVVSVGTGMRRGELAAMRASRVDWEHRTYTVDSALSNLWDDAGDLIVKEPKTKRARRVPLGAPVADALLRQSQLLERRAAEARRELVADPWLWSASADAGKPRPPQWFSHEFAACRDAAGVKGRLHDMRHAFATLALDAGIPLPTVSEMLGHSSPAITASIYSHGVAVTARRAADTVGAMLSRRAGELEA